METFRQKITPHFRFEVRRPFIHRGRSPTDCNSKGDFALTLGGLNAYGFGGSNKDEHARDKHTEHKAI